MLRLLYLPQIERLLTATRSSNLQTQLWQLSSAMTRPTIFLALACLLIALFALQVNAAKGKHRTAHTCRAPRNCKQLTICCPALAEHDHAVVSQLDNPGATLDVDVDAARALLWKKNKVCILGDHLATCA